VGGTQNGANITVGLGESATCTITNDDNAATLIVKKIVINDNGGTKQAQDFTFQVNGSSAISFEADGQNDFSVNAGTYNVTEPAVTGYTTTYDNCSNLVIPNGGTATCMITNDDIAQVNSQITPTATTCDLFNSGQSATLSELQYTVKAGKINQVNPGVFFYWIKVDANAGLNIFTIQQTITTNNFDSHFFSKAAGSAVFTSSCVKVTSTIDQSGADTTITFNAASAGTYIIGVKYDAGSVKGFAPPIGNGGVASYNFAELNTPGSDEGINLVPKP
jgi:hypothetical protein